MPEKLRGSLGKSGAEVATKFRIRVLAKRFGKRLHAAEQVADDRAVGRVEDDSPRTPTTTAERGRRRAAAGRAPDPRRRRRTATATASPTRSTPTTTTTCSPTRSRPTIKTNRCIADTDGDGMEDGWEYQSAFDLNRESCPRRRRVPDRLHAGDPAVPGQDAVPEPARRRRRRHRLRRRLADRRRRAQGVAAQGRRERATCTLTALVQRRPAGQPVDDRPRPTAAAAWSCRRPARRPPTSTRPDVRGRTRSTRCGRDGRRRLPERRRARRGRRLPRQRRRGLRRARRARAGGTASTRSRCYQVDYDGHRLARRRHRRRRRSSTARTTRTTTTSGTSRRSTAAAERRPGRRSTRHRPACGSTPFNPCLPSINSRDVPAGRPASAATSGARSTTTTPPTRPRWPLYGDRAPVVRDRGLDRHDPAGAQTLPPLHPLPRCPAPGRPTCPEQRDIRLRRGARPRGLAPRALYGRPRRARRRAARAAASREPRRTATPLPRIRALVEREAGMLDAAARDELVAAGGRALVRARAARAAARRPRRRRGHGQRRRARVGRARRAAGARPASRSRPRPSCATRSSGSSRRSGAASTRPSRCATRGCPTARA